MTNKIGLTRISLISAGLLAATIMFASCTPSAAQERFATSTDFSAQQQQDKGGSRKAAPAARSAQPQRAAPQRAAPQRAAPQRAAPQRAAPRVAAPQRTAPRTVTQTRATSRVVRQPTATSRAVRQPKATSRTVTQRKATSRTVTQRKATSRAATQRKATSRAVTQRKATSRAATQRKPLRGSQATESHFAAVTHRKPLRASSRRAVQEPSPHRACAGCQRAAPAALSFAAIITRHGAADTAYVMAAVGGHLPRSAPWAPSQSARVNTTLMPTFRRLSRIAKG